MVSVLVAAPATIADWLEEGRILGGDLTCHGGSTWLSAHPLSRWGEKLKEEENSSKCKSHLKKVQVSSLAIVERHSGKRRKLLGRLRESGHTKAVRK